MAVELCMIGLMTRDMSKSLTFYRRLGLNIPDGSEGKTHVEVKMSGGLTFFLDSYPARWDPDYPDESDFAGKDQSEQSVSSAGYPFILEFYLKDRAVLDAKYKELAGFGYQSRRAPYVTSFGMYFALINDPDGNTILLSADNE